MNTRSGLALQLRSRLAPLLSSRCGCLAAAAASSCACAACFSCCAQQERPNFQYKLTICRNTCAPSCQACSLNRPHQEGHCNTALRPGITRLSMPASRNGGSALLSGLLQSSSESAYRLLQFATVIIQLCWAPPQHAWCVTAVATGVNRRGGTHQGLALLEGAAQRLKEAEEDGRVDAIAERPRAHTPTTRQRVCQIRLAQLLRTAFVPNHP